MVQGVILHIFLGWTPPSHSTPLAGNERIITIIVFILLLVLIFVSSFYNKKNRKWIRIL